MSELDIACERLRRALTPYAIERKEKREREFTLYLQLAWSGKEVRHYGKARVSTNS